VAELRIEVIDLADQLVDPLRDVLPALMRFPEIAFQRLDALHPRCELLSEASILLAQPFGRIDQCSDGALEAIEVVRRIVLCGLCDSIADDLGNDVSPQTFRIVPVPRSPSRNSAHFCAPAKVELEAFARSSNCG
jgi:hypothetical protein